MSARPATTAFTRAVAALARRGPSRPAPDRDGAGDEQAIKRSLLRQVEILAPLSSSDLAWVAANTTMVSCPRGRVVYDPQHSDEVTYLLKHGRISLYRLTADGRKLTVATLNAGSSFGAMGMLGQRMFGCYAEAATDCLVCVMSRADLETLMHRNPDVAIRLLDELGARLLDREQDLVQFAFRDIPSRLAALLLREADAYGTVTGYSHQDLADWLGTYRETVSQVLGRFRREGLVAVEPKRIRLLKLDALRAYAAE